MMTKDMKQAQYEEVIMKLRVRHANFTTSEIVYDVINFRAFTAALDDCDTMGESNCRLLEPGYRR
jgi:hypothetical protein